MMMRWRITIYGKVQGVFYRKSTQEQAIELGLCGWVMNQEDGSVLAEIQGPATALETMKSWCEQGPPMADVERVEAEAINTTDPCNGFYIKY